MKIKVIGKAHLKGASKKSGNNYDFIQIHYIGRARGAEGQAALTLSLEPRDYSYADVVVGGYYDVEFDNRGYIVECPKCGKYQPLTWGKIKFDADGFRAGTNMDVDHVRRHWG